MDNNRTKPIADVLVVAGNADAREIIVKLTELGINVAATVTTALGSTCLPQHERLKVFEGRLEAEGMAALLEETQAACLVDASHPFAEAATRHAVRACQLSGLPYLRFERPPTEADGLPHYRVKGYEAAALRVREIAGNILLTIGSRHLEIFTRQLPDFKERLFVRVLPDSKVLAQCEQLGLGARNILAIKGPFTVEMNLEMLKYCQARVLVTKDSGAAGGTWAKLKAAHRLAIPALLIDRPTHPGGTVSGQISVLIEQVQSCLSRSRPAQGVKT